MDSLVNQLHSVVSDVHVASEVSSVVERLVSSVERNADRQQRTVMTLAVRLARRKMEELASLAAADAAAQAERSRHAAKLKQDFAAEVARVAAELRAKARVESELVATRNSLAGTREDCDSLAKQLADLKSKHEAVLKERAELKQRLQARTNGDYLFFRLSNPALGRVFQFLGTKEALRMAATNKALYRRMDAFFVSQGGRPGPRGVPRAGYQAPSVLHSSISPTYGRGGHMSPRRHGGSFESRGSFGERMMSSKGSKGKNSPASKKSLNQMQKQLNHCQAALAEVRAENEDIRQKLQAATQVKEFLVTKLSETNDLVRQAKEEKERVLAQAASDRSVITFLDSRVRELEEKGAKTIEQLQAAQQAAASINETHNVKTKNLESMLWMAEAQRDKDKEQHKTEKKILANEIKSLRHKLGMLSKAVAKERKGRGASIGSMG